MKKFLNLTSVALLVVMLCTLSGCSATRKIAVIAHAGFWNCEEAGRASNSVAALAAAQANAFWGCECDVNLTSDDVVVVVHGPKWKDVEIRNNSYAETVRFLTLKNGETIPSLDQYLDQLEKARTVLVLELKVQLNEERERIMVDKAIESLKAHGLYDPRRVIFISFSPYICKKIAKEHPQFINQYLNGDLSPAKLHKDGINGIDYNYKVLHKHPEWVREAHDLGMNVNVWTIDKEEEIKEMIELGVDHITTNEPLLTRALIKAAKKKELPVPRK